MQEAKTNKPYDYHLKRYVGRWYIHETRTEHNEKIARAQNFEKKRKHNQMK